MPTYPGNKIILPPFRITPHIPGNYKVGCCGEMLLIRDGIDFPMEICLRKPDDMSYEVLWFSLTERRHDE